MLDHAGRHIGRRVIGPADTAGRDLDAVPQHTAILGEIAEAVTEEGIPGARVPIGIPPQGGPRIKRFPRVRQIVAVLVLRQREGRGHRHGGAIGRGETGAGLHDDLGPEIPGGKGHHIAETGIGHVVAHIPLIRIVRIVARPQAHRHRRERDRRVNYRQRRRLDHLQRDHGLAAVGRQPRGVARQAHGQLIGQGDRRRITDVAKPVPIRIALVHVRHQRTVIPAIGHEQRGQIVGFIGAPVVIGIRIAGIAEPIAIRIGLIGVRHQRTIVPAVGDRGRRVGHPVAIEGLVANRVLIGIQIADVADPVAIRIELGRIAQPFTIIGQIADAVAIGIGEVRIGPQRRFLRQGEPIAVTIRLLLVRRRIGRDQAGPHPGHLPRIGIVAIPAADLPRRHAPAEEPQRHARHPVIQAPGLRTAGQIQFRRPLPVHKRRPKPIAVGVRIAGIAPLVAIGIALQRIEGQRTVIPAGPHRDRHIRDDKAHCGLRLLIEPPIVIRIGIAGIPQALIGHVEGVAIVIPLAHVRRHRTIVDPIPHPIAIGVGIGGIAPLQPFIEIG